MNYGSLWVSYKYNARSINLGDCIQKLAVDKLLKSSNIISIERDSLTDENSKVVLPLQGWFTYKGLKDRSGNTINIFPVNNNIDPIFIGFHLSNEGYSRKKFILDKPYLTTNLIGCRDISTYNFLKSLGYNAYISLCLTTTFDKREKSADQIYNYCIDCDPRNGEIFLSNEMKIGTQLNIDQWNYYYKLAQNRLLELKQYAKSIRTSRLHIYLPCIAMGIPVKYEGAYDERTDIINIINEHTIDELKPLIINNFYSQLKYNNDYVDKLMNKIKEYL